MNKSRRVSKIWQFFSCNNEKHARCNVCKNNVSYKSSTSNLRKHLQRKHESVYNKFRHQMDMAQILRDIHSKDSPLQQDTPSNKSVLSNMDNVEEIDIGYSLKFDDSDINLWNQSQQRKKIEKNDGSNAEKELPTKRKSLEDRNSNQSPFLYDSTGCLLCGRKSEKAFEVVMEIKEQMDKRDEHVVFGEYVANQIRNLQSNTRQQTARQCITNILHNLKFTQNNYENPETLNDESSNDTSESFVGNPASPQENTEIVTPPFREINNSPTATIAVVQQTSNAEATVQDVTSTQLSVCTIADSTLGLFPTPQTATTNCSSPDPINAIGNHHIFLPSQNMIDSCLSRSIMCLPSSEEIGLNDQLIVKGDVVYLSPQTVGSIHQMEPISRISSLFDDHPFDDPAFLAKLNLHNSPESIRAVVQDLENIVGDDLYNVNVKEMSIVSDLYASDEP